MAKLKDDMCAACPTLKDLAARLELMTTLVNELRSDHNAHCAATHSVADAVNVVTSPALATL
jgi:hypothetical protein